MSDDCDWCEGLGELAEGVACPRCWPGMYMELAPLPATAAEFVVAYGAQREVRCVCHDMPCKGLPGCTDSSTIFGASDAAT